METKRLQSWEEGCERDPIRNEVLIPFLCEILNRLKPASILDIGIATGYIARNLHTKLQHQPVWTLLDVNRHAVEFAAKLSPKSMRVEFVVGTLESLEDEALFDTILFTFTLLEIRERERLFTKIVELLSPKGSLIIGLPDCFADILKQARENKDFSLLNDFLSGVVSLDKADKFTGENYPFHVERMSAIIEHALAAGLVLESLCRKEADGVGVFILVFGKMK